MALAHSNDEFRSIVKRLADKYMQYHEGVVPYEEEEKTSDEKATAAAEPDCNLKIPPWICQPYYRLPPEEHKQMMEEKLKLASERGKRQYFDKDGNEISRKQMKKIKRLEKRAKAKSIERQGEICKARKCSNTKGLKCEFHLCRHCCRNKCLMEIVNCNGHKIFTESTNKNSTDSERMDNDDDNECFNREQTEANANGQQAEDCEMVAADAD
jgi:tRNA-dihydrouridine synthase 1